MKRIIAIFLLVSTVFAVFAGCSKNEPEPADSTASSDVSSIDNVGVISTADVVFVDPNNESVYRVIRPEEGELGESELASTVYKKIKESFGVSPKNLSDSEDGTDAYEILIGNTNRPESRQAIDYMIGKGNGRFGDFIICTIGKKIVINAVTPEALKAAVQYFNGSYLKETAVKGGIEYIYVADGDFSNITVNGNSIAKFNIIRPHLNSSYLPQLETEKIVEFVRETTGYILSIEDDEYTEEGDYEIVVGNCNRSAVQKVSDTDSYNITVSVNKIYLNGGSPHSTAMAVSEFAKILKKGSVTDSDSVSGSYSTAIAGYDKKTTYTPAWYDTFDGDELDTTKWRMMGGTEFGRKGQNGKMSYMSDDPKYVYQKDGKFYINAQEKEDAYYGGCILNDNIMVFRYGYVEMSALCPDGPGFWSLIYFYQPDNTKAGPFVGANQGYYNPEIDLNECFGNGRMTYFNCHAHPTDKGDLAGKEHVSFDNSPYKADRIYYCPDGKTFADDFHTYGLIWDETKMAMVADGKVHFTYEFSEDYDIDAFVETYLCMKIAFSVARENNNLNINQVSEEQWNNSSTMIVDYVYLYQFQDGVQDLIYLK